MPQGHCPWFQSTQMLPHKLAFACKIQILFSFLCSNQVTFVFGNDLIDCILTTRYRIDKSGNKLPPATNFKNICSVVILTANARNDRTLLRLQKW